MLPNKDHISKNKLLSFWKWIGEDSSEAPRNIIKQEENRDAARRGNTVIFTRLFDKSLLRINLARHITTDSSTRGFDLMEPYATPPPPPFRNQMSIGIYCFLVYNRLAVSVQLRPGGMKRLNRLHPGKKAIQNVSNYLMIPHKHKDFM